VSKPARKLLYLLSSFALVCAVVFAFWLLRGRSTPNETLETIESVNQADEARMGLPVDELEKAKSLERMSFQNPIKAQEFSRIFAAEKSVILRAAGCKAAGSFPGEEWDKIILKGLADKELAVRIATLKGLRRQPTDKRQAAVRILLKQKRLDASESFWGHMALMPEPGDKSILSLLDQVDRSTQSEGLIQLYKAWPKQNELFAFAEKVLNLGMENQDYLPGFHYLAAYGPEVLAKFLAASAFPDSRMFLLETLGFIKQSCPKEWPAIIKKIEGHLKVDDQIRSEIKACASACPMS
jgi:hypothetical protein